MRKALVFISAIMIAFLLAWVFPTSMRRLSEGDIIFRGVLFLFSFFMAYSILYPLSSYFTRNKRMLAQLPLLICFFALIAYPFLATERFDEQQENRKASEQPLLILENKRLNELYPSQFESWFGDHFGGRKKLIQANAKLHYTVFRQSISDMVIIGKDEWLLYAKKTDGTPIEYYQRYNLWPPEKLELAKEKLTALQADLQEHGIPVVFVMTPSQFDIYPEKFPDSIVRIEGPSVQDQLIAYLQANTEIPVFDLRQPLLSYKENAEEELFYQAGTHWNDLGAFLGYEMLIDGLSDILPEIVPLTRDDFEIEKEYSTAAGEILPHIDLALEDFRGKLFTYTFTPRVPYAYEKTASLENPTTFFTVQENESLPHAIIFRDSFFEAMQPFFSAHFSKADYIWTVPSRTAHLEYILSEKPDVVVFELTSRYLEHLLGIWE